jgi:hypothetical protein
MMRTLGRLVGLIAVVAGLGCTSGPKGDTLNGTWQGSGATDDVLQVTQTGDDVAGKILEGGSQVGSVSGTDVAVR